MSFATPWKTPLKAVPAGSGKNTLTAENGNEPKKVGKAKSSRMKESDKENQTPEKVAKPKKSEIATNGVMRLSPPPKQAKEGNAKRKERALSDVEYDELFKLVLEQGDESDNVEERPGTSNNAAVDTPSSQPGPSQTFSQSTPPLCNAPIQHKPSSQPGPSHAFSPSTPTPCDAQPEPECARQRITPLNTFLAPEVRKRNMNAPKKQRMGRMTVEGVYARKINFGRAAVELGAEMMKEEKKEEEKGRGRKKKREGKKKEVKKVKRRRILSPADSTPATNNPTQSQTQDSPSQSQPSRVRLSQSVSQLVSSQLAAARMGSPPSGLTRTERLHWYQERREVGTWVRCDKKNCDKWRYLPLVNDPVVLPNKWYCKLHPDPTFNHCDAPEVGPTLVEEEDLIHNLYTAGSIVWARLPGFPWWPAMVDDCPDTEQFYWLNEYSDIPTHYNVTFFDDRAVTRAWIAPTSLQPFGDRELYRQATGTMNGVNYSFRIAAAQKQANEAMPLSISERLKKYSFVTRYSGQIGELDEVKVPKKQPAPFKKRSAAAKKRRVMAISSSEDSDEEPADGGWRMSTKANSKASNSLTKLMFLMDQEDEEEERKEKSSSEGSESETEDDEESSEEEDDEVKAAGKDPKDDTDKDPGNGASKSDKSKDVADGDEANEPHNQSADLFSESDETEMVSGIDAVIDNMTGTTLATSMYTDMTRLATAGTSATQHDDITEASSGIIPDTGDDRDSSTLGYVSQTQNLFEEAAVASRIPPTVLSSSGIIPATGDTTGGESLISGTANLFSQESVGFRLPTLTPMATLPSQGFATSTPNSSLLASENARVPDMDDIQAMLSDNAGLYEAVVPEIHGFDDLNISHIESQDSEAFEFEAEE